METHEVSFNRLLSLPDLNCLPLRSDMRAVWLPSHYPRTSAHELYCVGENPSRVYSQTRMDSAWNFRSAYNEARKIRDAQDAFCDRVKHGQAADEEAFPENLQWEALVDVLRGRVKVCVLVTPMYARFVLIVAQFTALNSLL